LTCVDLLLLALLRLAPWYQDVDDSFQQRAELYYPVAVAICAVALNDTERAFLARQAYEETKLARYVLEERCQDGPAGVRCDEGLATGPWQVWGYCKRAWTATYYEERLAAGAACSLRLARMCRTPEGWFAAQWGGRECVSPLARKRVPGFWRMLAQIKGKVQR
jgi:hypothetical protein